MIRKTVFLSFGRNWQRSKRSLSETHRAAPRTATDSGETGNK